MRCAALLVATAMLSQIVIGNSLNYSPRPHITATFIHPPWWEPKTTTTTTTTTTPRPTTTITTTIKTTTLTPAQLLAYCIAGCPVSMEYKPVCGSNNITYLNAGRLECDRKCGVAVRLIKHTPCISETTTEKPLSLAEQIAACLNLCPETAVYKPVCGSNNVTYVNRGRLECEQNCGIPVRLIKHTSCIPETTTEKPLSLAEQIKACLNLCPETAVYKPVCGSNNVTYVNLGRLECEQNCGIPVRLIKHTPCIPETTTEKPLSLAEQIAACLNSCPETAVYKPVCGSNNVTYVNRGRLECEQNCGIPVKLSKSAPCVSEMITTTEKSLTLAEQISACLKTCPETTEYKPVCGSNNATYMNRKRLECEKNCGIPVQLSKNTPCVSETCTTEKPLSLVEQITSCFESCPNNTEYNPVCGSNNATYMNRERLECEQNCGIPVQLTRWTACPVSISTTTQKILSRLDVVACMRNCPMNTERNSVCGSNNVTYVNQGRLECEQNCGIPVHLIKLGPCLVGVTRTEHNISITEKLSSCISSCTVNKEYNPVCGNNNVTYPNFARLECERKCGVSVQLTRWTACPAVSIQTTTENIQSKEDVVACMRYCPMTTERNPVCGSNNVTYANFGRLECEQICGIPVQLSKLGPCLPGLTTTERNTTSTTAQISICISSCPVNKEYNPVCGSNNVTYPNFARLECERICGVAVQLTRWTACPVSISTTTQNILSRLDVVACMRNCPMTTEINSVCGSNNVTYVNQGQLECEQSCGIPVQLSNLGPCLLGLTRTDHNISITVQLSSCINSCPVNVKYNPVCGSNNVTYPNFARLECERICGVAVQLTRWTSCPVSFSTTTDNILSRLDVVACMRKCPMNTEQNSVCGSNNVTYVNFGRLECEQNCGISVHLSKLGPCLPELTTTKRTISIKEKISSCISSCPVNVEYNPVCGSNNVTYPNLARLECEQKCGVAVQVTKWTACPAVSISTTTENILSKEDVIACMRNCPMTTERNSVCGSNNVTYVNRGRLECEQNCGIPVQFSKLGPCIPGLSTTERTLSITEHIISSCVKSCPVTEEYKPVCGSNNMTYPNFGLLECERKCGVEVHVTRWTSCPVSISINILSREEVIACVRNCAMSTEYNPVCGSNNVTYMNRGRLECERNCGISVQLNKLSPCKPESTDKGKTSNNMDPLSACMESCPETEEINPVCGSNNVTYKNLERLECEQNCGVLVYLSSLGPCSPEEDEISACLNSCPGSSEYSPVCGSDNVTYANLERLECSQSCGVDVQLSTMTSCSEKPTQVNLNDTGARTNACSKNTKTPSIEEVMTCTQACILTSEYNPVCGTDNITYANPGRLICAQFCGVDVYLRKFASCSSNIVTNYPRAVFVGPVANDVIADEAQYASSN